MEEPTELESLIGDIQLSLQLIHKKEHIISDFSEDEDMNFADCY